MKGTPINNDTQTMLSVNRSCCGKSFNASNAEIIGSVYVDDDYIKREAVDWIQKNINKYKFIGKEARDLKITLKNYIGSIPNLNEINRILVEFFEIYANNPFCVENGIGVTEKSYIIGKSLDCYFVNYKDGIDIPFGCLEHFVHNKVEIVQNEYMEKAKDFAVSSVKTSLSCIQNIETNLQKTEKNHYATFLRFCIGVLTLVLSCIYVIYCATKVDWINIEYISERSANWYQIVGFAAEKGFIIGHNCSLNHILLGLASFWLVYIAITNIKVVKEYKNAKNYEKLKKINNYMLTLKDSLPAIEEEIIQANSFINDNMECYEKIFIKPRYFVKKFGPKICCVEENQNIMYNDTMNPILPKNGWIIIFFILILGTSLFGYISRDDNFKIKYRDSIRNMQYESSISELKAKKSYITTSESDVFTKDDEDSLVLYQIGENTKCELIDDESSETLFEISFLTEYGYLEGWIFKDAVTEYNPYYDTTVKKAMPNECLSSSELTGTKYYGASNAADGVYSTSWQEGSDGNGCGEWILFKYDEFKEISAIGVYNGNGSGEELYYANVRPIGITLYFYADESLIDSVSYTLQDGIFGVQYFDLNKPIVANSIRLSIDSISEGTEYQDACIAEMEVYYAEVNGEESV